MPRCLASPTSRSATSGANIPTMWTTPLLDRRGPAPAAWAVLGTVKQRWRRCSIAVRSYRGPKRREPQRTTLRSSVENAMAPFGEWQFQSLLVERRWWRSRRSLCARMRFISSSSASISSERRVSLDFVASAARSFSSAFSTESFGVSAMANLVSRRDAFGPIATSQGRRLPSEMRLRPENCSGRSRSQLPLLQILRRPPLI